MRGKVSQYQSKGKYQVSTLIFDLQYWHAAVTFETTCKREPHSKRLTIQTVDLECDNSDRQNPPEYQLGIIRHKNMFANHYRVGAGDPIVPTKIEQCCFQSEIY